MKFSIIIPVYNNKEWIGHCFQSILDQTYTNYEVIIVDDMSTDGGMEIIRDYEKKFKEKNIPCKVIINKSKRLNGGSRNVGIVEAKGEYIMCIDCDDWFIDNNVFADIASKLSGEDCMFLGCVMRTPEQDINLIPVHNSWWDAMKGCLCALWTKCVRADVLKGCLMKEGTLFEDLGHHYRIMQHINTFTSYGKASHVWNRLNTQSVSHSDYYLQYRFNFCQEIYELIQNTTDPEVRAFLVDALKMYYNSCKGEMIDKL